MAMAGGANALSTLHRGSLLILLCAALTLSLSEAAPLSITLSASVASSGLTSLDYGVNSGHSFDASSQLFLRHLGVSTARVFGGSGGLSPSDTWNAGHYG